ncbi:MAG TPA: hypothetical protein VFV77_04555 [Gammaproteobacteria bacterium]|nr:hypothetical protein [Gammaproteobacteria bacterium]
MFARTAASVMDVVVLFKLAIFRDFKSTLFNYGVNVGFTLLVLLLMRRMHSGAYQVFYDFVTGALNPGILVVMAAVVIVLVGAEFIFMGLTFYPKGFIPDPVAKLILSIRDSIVVLSGVALALALVMFASDPASQWKAYATAVVYLASAYLLTFLCFAPFYLESNRIADRISLIIAGAGLIALVWFWPDIFSPEVVQLNQVIG